MSNIIEITNLCKTYNSSKRYAAKEALIDVNLAIPKGMIYGLLGPNGAGKSTLINILAGLAVKSSGKVLVNDFDLDVNDRAVRGSLGVVPQEVVLDPFFSIREALEYHAGYYGVPKSERKTDEILAALSLTGKAHLNSRRLSGGMKRRVLIAKALVHNPPILILDEPTAGVDVELREQLWDYVRELNARGTTILLTTHYLEEAENLCERIAIINHGQIIVEGSTRELKTKLDKRQLTLQVEQSLKQVPKSFVSDGVEVELIDEHRLQINYHANQISINTLLDFTKQANLTIKDLSMQEPDLEDIFRLYVSDDNNAMV